METKDKLRWAYWFCCVGLLVFDAVVWGTYLYLTTK